VFNDLSELNAQRRGTVPVRTEKKLGKTTAYIYQDSGKAAVMPQ